MAGVRVTEGQAAGDAPPRAGEAQELQEAAAVPPPPPPPPAPAGALSVGSELHASGSCRPCSFFHRPSGCQNGAECRHCHLCPDGEIKARRKSRFAGSRADAHKSGAAPVGAVAPRVPQPLPRPLPLLLGAVLPRPVPPFSSKAARPLPQPSAGSALHGAGSCRPCAFLWRPAGCDRGLACQHCHICPPLELQARRRAKQALLRQGVGGEGDSPPPASPKQAPLRHVAWLEMSAARSMLVERTRDLSELSQPMSIVRLGPSGISEPSEPSELSEPMSVDLLAELRQAEGDSPGMGGCLAPPPGL